MKMKLIIFPFNGNALEAYDCLGDNFELVCFVDDETSKYGEYDGVPITSRKAIEDHPDALILAVPGSPISFKRRKEFIDSLNIAPERFATVIHPNASVSKLATIGRNTLIMAGVVITSDAKIGDHVCLLPNSVVHHDSRVENYSLVGSSVVVAGGTVVHQNCYIGSRSSLINGITVGEFTLVGMGSNVVSSIESHSVIVGNPAKPLVKK
jgi:sugar O-acyltransferase (sialic acid O-acetyltransferase NeuD family)